MKATDLEVKEFTIEQVYKQIELDAKNAWTSSAFPLMLNITEKTKNRLMEDGFTLSRGVRFNEESLIVGFKTD